MSSSRRGDAGPVSAGRCSRTAPPRAGAGSGIFPQVPSFELPAGVAPGARAGGPAALGASRRQRVRPRGRGRGGAGRELSRAGPPARARARSRSASAPRSTAGSAWATARAPSSATTGSSGSTPPRRSAPGRSPASSTTRAAIWATSTATGSTPTGSTGPARSRRPGSPTATGPVRRHRQPELRADRRAGPRPPGRRRWRADFRGRPAGHVPGRRGAAGRRGVLRRRGGHQLADQQLGQAGRGVAAAGGGREIGIALIAHDGLSTQRQFFRRESRYIGRGAAVRPVAVTRTRRAVGLAPRSCRTCAAVCPEHPAGFGRLSRGPPLALRRSANRSLDRTRQAYLCDQSLALEHAEC